MKHPDRTPMYLFGVTGSPVGPRTLDPGFVADPRGRTRAALAEMSQARRVMGLLAMRFLLHQWPGAPKEQKYYPSSYVHAMLEAVRLYAMSPDLNADAEAFGALLGHYTGWEIPMHQDPTRVDGMDSGLPNQERPDGCLPDPPVMTRRQWHGWNIGPAMVLPRHTFVCFDAATDPALIGQVRDELRRMTRRTDLVGMGEPWPLVREAGPGPGGFVYRPDPARVGKIPWVMLLTDIRRLMAAGWRVDPKTTECHAIVRPDALPLRVGELEELHRAGAIGGMGGGLPVGVRQEIAELHLTGR